jgi:hypothetical protein
MNNMLTEFRIQSRFFKFLKSSEWATWFLDAYSVKLMFPINPLKEYRKLKLKLFCFNGIMLALYTLAVFGAIELFVPLKSPFLIPIVWVWSWTAMTLFQAFIMDTILNGWLTSEWKTCQFRSELCQVLRMVAVNEKSGGLVTESLLLL